MRAKIMKLLPACLVLAIACTAWSVHTEYTRLANRTSVRDYERIAPARPHEVVRLVGAESGGVLAPDSGKEPFYAFALYTEAALRHASYLGAGEEERALYWKQVMDEQAALFPADWISYVK